MYLVGAALVDLVALPHVGYRRRRVLLLLESGLLLQQLLLRLLKGQLKLFNLALLLPDDLLDLLNRLQGHLVPVRFALFRLERCQW